MELVTRGYLPAPDVKASAAFLVGTMWQERNKSEAFAYVGNGSQPGSHAVVLLVQSYGVTVASLLIGDMLRGENPFAFDYPTARQVADYVLAMWQRPDAEAVPIFSGWMMRGMSYISMIDHTNYIQWTNAQIVQAGAAAQRSGAFDPKPLLTTDEQAGIDRLNASFSPDDYNDPIDRSRSRLNDDIWGSILGGLDFGDDTDD